MNPCLTAYEKHKYVDKLMREILIELIDFIKIYEGGDISNKFKFSDELQRIVEYIEVQHYLRVG